MIVHCKDWLFSIQKLAINFNNDNILKIIRFLNINKAHGYDNVSVRTIEICDKAIVNKPLSIVIRTVLTMVYSQIYERNLFIV